MSLNILVVDDSPMIRRIVGQILAESDFTVLSAEDGEKGYEAAKDHHPDLIIMDIEMPVMDGIEATSRIKSDADTSDIPILIFTSLGSELMPNLYYGRTPYHQMLLPLFCFGSF